MDKDYVTASCPCCSSIVCMERKAARTTFFTCPVCLEGELSLADEPAKMADPIAASTAAQRVPVAV